MRYLILIILIVTMLVPVWGWAVDICVDTGTGECVDWDSVKKEYVPIKPVPNCEQRMREAMTSIDPYVQGREEFYTHVRGWRMGSVTKDQWDQTMKDCVEGQ